MRIPIRGAALAVTTMALLLWPAGVLPQNESNSGPVVDPALFKESPLEFRGHPMFSFNLSNLSEETLAATIQDYANKYGAGGVTPEPAGGATTGLSEAFLKGAGRAPTDKGVVYLSDEYFKYYRIVLEQARKLGMEVVLYDEWRYPSGSAGGQFYSKYPEYAAKNLRMAEKNVTGPASAELAVPEGIYVGAVMMNRDTYELVDISSRYAAGSSISATTPGSSRSR